MKFQPIYLKGAFLIDLDRFTDERGWFARTYCKNEFKEILFEKDIVQINHSTTKIKGSIRGLHFQHPPKSETKLIRCIKGSVYDVIVDLRKQSETFLKWYGVNLSSKNKKMIVIPEGFAHGFQTLTNNAQLIYHHTEFYAPEYESGILYNDPNLNIQWPISLSNISDRDLSHEKLNSNFKGLDIKI